MYNPSCVCDESSLPRYTVCSIMHCKFVVIMQDRLTILPYIFTLSIADNLSKIMLAYIATTFFYVIINGIIMVVSILDMKGPHRIIKGQICQLIKSGTFNSFNIQKDGTPPLFFFHFMSCYISKCLIESPLTRSLIFIYKQ